MRLFGIIFKHCDLGMGTRLIDCDCNFANEYIGTKLLTYNSATDYETVRILEFTKSKNNLNFCLGFT